MRLLPLPRGGRGRPEADNGGTFIKRQSKIGYHTPGIVPASIHDRDKGWYIDP
jgi:hypothetical protein